MSITAGNMLPQGVPLPEGPTIFGETCGGGEWWRVKILVTTLKPASRLAYK